MHTLLVDVLSVPAVVNNLHAKCLSIYVLTKNLENYVYFLRMLLICFNMQQFCFPSIMHTKDQNTLIEQLFIRSYLSAISFSLMALTI